MSSLVGGHLLELSPLVMLSEAKHLSGQAHRCFASLSMTVLDLSVDEERPVHLNLALALEDTADQEWLLRRFHTMFDMLYETPAFQELIQEGRREGREEGLEEGLQEGRLEALRLA